MGTALWQRILRVANMFDGDIPNGHPYGGRNDSNMKYMTANVPGS